MKQFLPSDISRCMNDDCILRESCLRWLLRNDENACTFISPVVETGLDCDYHIQADFSEG